VRKATHAILDDAAQLKARVDRLCAQAGSVSTLRRSASIRLKIERHCPHIVGRRGRRIVQTAAEDKCIFSGSWFPTDSDETPAGRAAAALRVQLRASFSEHRFEFLSSKDVKPEKVEELLFHVLGAGLIGADDEVVGEVPSHDLDQTVQETIDEIVAKAIARSVN
jgi:hypothetical protein